MKLEKSHELTLQLEEKVKNVNHSDSSLIELMEKVREASAAELKRFMEETKATYILNVSLSLVFTINMQKLLLTEFGISHSYKSVINLNRLNVSKETCVYLIRFKRSKCVWRRMPST